MPSWRSITSASWVCQLGSPVSQLCTTSSETCHSSPLTCSIFYSRPWLVCIHCTCVRWSWELREKHLNWLWNQWGFLKQKSLFCFLFVLILKFKKAVSCFEVARPFQVYVHTIICFCLGQYLIVLIFALQYIIFTYILYNIYFYINLHALLKFCQFVLDEITRTEGATCSMKTVMPFACFCCV